ncbi:TIGR03767 family metallophosphoesterase [Rhodococcus spongiicola]|uniref:TIGR03767 family metallophosphoesterase n=1 Tax=Rhodococcus spongiicola TaxID=2487352 RepID=A0A3S3ZN33_9NOCA|nr:TIGR03767 family metallophosphoesterase [Rhodococcus spongiicola]RVW04466.1 TIGR03767 family metallophosphoesterase [Rhodococcus spongiicola]
MNDMNRRKFLGAAGVGALGVAGLPLLGNGSWNPLIGRALAAPLPSSIAGTTLESVAVPLGSSGYRRLTAGQGWPLVVRNDLADPEAGREDRRTALASLVQLTDVHVLDAQSPVRFEYVHPFQPSAYRPQETMTAQGLISLVNRVNSLRMGPHTQREFDAVVTTGDNTDNKEFIELDWFLAALNGGDITPNSGDPAQYEGVQNSGADLYWNPESSIQDIYKQAGFPEIPGLLGAALQPVVSPGLNTKWYCVFGNHDDAVQGTLPNGISFFENMYTGSKKFEVPDSANQSAQMSSAMSSDPTDLLNLLSAITTRPRTVTPDERRTPFTPREFIAAHLDPANTGPGPVGHGFAPDAAESGIGYYTFEIAPGVIGISMDSTNRAGFVDGSLGEEQFEWIEQTLLAGSSKYYETDGSLVTQDRTDTYFVLFSHHTSTSMANTRPDPERPQEPRIKGAQLVDLLHRFPNVLAWVNGHTHENRITPQVGQTPEQSFWEINTASHIDFPQQGRIIEIVDNEDGTVSLLTTLFEADSPYQVDYDDFSPTGLASLYREFSFNDIHADPALLGGSPDHNVELVLRTMR